MSTCDDVQLSLEMARKGAIPLVPEPDARAHAATCPHCAAYAATLKETELMTTTHWNPTTSFDAKALYETVMAEMNPPLRRRLLGAALGVLGLALFIGALYLGTGREGLRETAPQLIATVLVVGGGLVLYGRQRVRQWRALAGAQAGEIIAKRRAELIELQRIRKFALPFLAIVLVANIVLTTRSTAEIIVTSTILGLVIAGDIPGYFRTRRELAELA